VLFTFCSFSQTSTSVFVCQKPVEPQSRLRTSETNLRVGAMGVKSLAITVDTSLDGLGVVRVQQRCSCRIVCVYPRRARREPSVFVGRRLPTSSLESRLTVPETT